VFDLARELSKTHEVNVIAPGAKGLKVYETIGSLKIFRFHYFFPHEYEKLAYGDGILNNLGAKRKYRALVPPFTLSFLIKSIRIGSRCDLIHAQWVFSGLIGLLGKRVHGRPVILTVRGSDINVEYGEAKSLEWVVPWVMRGCDYITAVSKDLSRTVIERFGVADKITFVPNGVSLEVFSPMDRSEARQALELPLRVPIVLYAGRILASKGIECLVRAIPDVLKSYQEARFFFLGEGEFGQRLVELCREMGITQNVRFIGKKPHEELPLWLNAADLMVLPSFSEGRPNTILEAMACAKPVVASRVGGIPELVHDGDNGFLVNPNDPDALSRAILMVLNMGSRRDLVGKRGREILESLALDWRASAQRMTEVYRRVLKEG
jgi:glycosyltransferase involved in cell wall biosynthesis